MHPRDARIVFEPEGHKYFVDGVPVDISVTGLWVQYFPSFEAEETIERSFNMWKTQVHNKYYQLLQYLELVEGQNEAAQKRAVAALWEGFWARFSLDHAGCTRLYPRGVAKGE